jgi:hypothetical protein
MKYIKEYQEHILYKVVDISEYWIAVTSEVNSEPFTKNEIDYLNDLDYFPRKLYSLTLNAFRTQATLKLKHNTLSIYRKKDDWFYVSFGSHANQINFNSEYRQFYKCDSFDGVKQLVKKYCNLII